MRGKGRILRRALKGQGPPGRQGGEGEEEDTARVFTDFFVALENPRNYQFTKIFAHIRTKDVIVRKE